MGSNNNNDDDIVKFNYLFSQLLKSSQSGAEIDSG